MPGKYRTRLLPDIIFFFFLNSNLKRYIMKVKMFSKFHFLHNTTTQLSNAVKILNYMDEISPTGTCSILLMAFDTQNNWQKETNCPNGIKMKTLFKKTAAKNLNFSRIWLAYYIFANVLQQKNTNKSISVLQHWPIYLFRSVIINVEWQNLGCYTWFTIV